MTPSVAVAISSMARVFMQKIDDDTIERIAEAVIDLAPEAVCEACDEITKHERFFPRPVVIRAYVERLQHQRTQQHTPAAAFVDPSSGERAVWRCLACQDQGLRPHNDKGHVISWDQVRAVGAFLGAPQVHCHHISRCTVCNMLAEPKSKLTKPTFDEQQSDRRGGWSRYNA